MLSRTRILKSVLVAAIGFLSAVFVYLRFAAPPVVMMMVDAMYSKAIGRNVPCTWSQIAKAPFSLSNFGDLKKRVSKSLAVIQTDERLGIELISTPTRPFWIKKAGARLDGRAELDYVLAEQDWISESTKEFSVRVADVVVDVGAHIGTFGDDALRRGASKVVMVEPDPVNIECIRRNFAKEITAGTVIVVPEGAWSKLDTLNFSVGVGNSGTGSFVLSDGGTQIEVPVRPLDDMLRSAGISRVNFIKMDIEGAERDALKGAAGTLARFKPRLMLDMYHRSDDEFVLSRVIAAANPTYRSACGACYAGKDGIVPYATFFY